MTEDQVLTATESADWRVQLDAVQQVSQPMPPAVRDRMIALCSSTDAVDVVVEAAAGALLDAGDIGLSAFLRAWADNDDTLAGWMENAASHRYLGVEADIDERLARLAETADPEVAELARYYRETMGWSRPATP